MWGDSADCNAACNTRSASTCRRPGQSEPRAYFFLKSPPQFSRANLRPSEEKITPRLCEHDGSWLRQSLRSVPAELDLPVARCTKVNAKPICRCPLNPCADDAARDSRHCSRTCHGLRPPAAWKMSTDRFACRRWHIAAMSGGKEIAEDWMRLR